MAARATAIQRLPTVVARVIAHQHRQRPAAEQRDLVEQHAEAERRKDDVLRLSYRRGRAIVAWCDENPLRVSAEAGVHIERLRAAMANREYIASLIAWACAWVPETTWLGCECPHFDHESTEPLDAEGIPSVTHPGAPVGIPAVNAGDALDAEILVATATPAPSEN